MMYPIFLWERWNGRLSPVIRYVPLGTEGQRLAEVRDVPGTARSIADIDERDLKALAKLFPAPPEES